MVKISVNDEIQQFAQPVNLRDFLQTYIPPNPAAAFAIALNGEFVPRAQYADTLLNDGDALDIVSPVGGG